MRIRSIRIKDFRKLAGPVCIDALGDGITVIAGDNEEGKSTLLHAIRAVLFEKHKLSGEDAQAMLPFDCSVRPEIDLDFEIDGIRYALRKAFCQRQEAELTWPGGKMRGDAAEEALRELLRFEAPRKGASKPEHQGIWGLFWVEQGKSFGGLAMNDGTRQTLTKAFENEVGTVLGGDRGRTLLAAIGERYFKLFRKDRPEPIGIYKQAHKAVDDLQAELAKTRADFMAYEQRVEELGRVRAELARQEREQIVSRAERRLGEAEAEQTRITELNGKLEKENREQDLAAAQLDAARSRWQTRAAKIEALKQAREATQTLSAELESAAVALEPMQVLRLAAEEDVAGAKHNDERAQEALLAADLALRRARSEHDLSMKRESLRKAETAARAAEDARVESEANRVDEASIARLRELAAKQREAGAKLDAAQTQVEFAPQPGRRVFVGEGEVLPTDALQLSERTTLALEGFGVVTIIPGGEDLGARREASYTADATLAEALAFAGVPDMTAAEAAHLQRHDLLGRIAVERRAVLTHAPEGLAALRCVVQAMESQATELRGEAVPSPATIADADAALEVMWKRRKETAFAVIAADKAFQRLAREQEQARGRLLLLQARLGAARDGARTLEDALAADRATIADASLLTTLADYTDSFRNARTLVGVAERALQEANPEIAAARHAAAQDALNTARDAIRRLRETMVGLEGGLRELDKQGLGERAGAKEGELTAAKRQLQRIERDAKAVKLLHETLHEAEREARLSFTPRIRERLAPYLAQLFPGAEIKFERERLEIAHLRRDGIDEKFDRLSVGTREQLAVLTRLAFADFLREKGQPAAVILDDALVYSDRKRLRQMQEILLRAAERLQILVLTCREDDYAGLGVRVVRLAQCGSGATSA